MRLELQKHAEAIARFLTVSQMEVAQPQTLPGSIVTRIDSQGSFAIANRSARPAELPMQGGAPVQSLHIPGMPEQELIQPGQGFIVTFVVDRFRGGKQLAGGSHSFGRKPTGIQRGARRVADGLLGVFEQFHQFVFTPYPRQGLGGLLPGRGRLGEDPGTEVLAIPFRAVQQGGCEIATSNHQKPPQNAVDPIRSRC